MPTCAPCSWIHSKRILAAFDHVISLDPNFASAYARRAGVLLRIYDLTSDVNERPRLNEEARAAAERAVALAPQLGEAHLALAGKPLHVHE